VWDFEDGFGEVHWESPQLVSSHRSAAMVALANAAGIDGVVERWPDVGRVATLRVGQQLAAVAVLERVTADGFWSPEVALGGELWHLGMVAVDARWRQRGAAGLLVDSAINLAHQENLALCAATSVGSPAGRLFASWELRGCRIDEASGIWWDCFWLPASTSTQ
jgi:GNAT superfamily N-acetyltransferase